MRKITVFLSLFIVAFAVAACDGPRTPINELRRLADEVEMNYDSYTEADVEKILTKLESLDNEFEKYDYSDEELREIYRLNGRLAAYLTKATMKNFGSVMEEFSTKFEGAVEGFFNAFDTDADVTATFELDEDNLTNEQLRKQAKEKGKKMGEKTRRFAIKFASGFEGFVEEFEEEMEILSDALEEEIDKMTDDIENRVEDCVDFD